MHVFGPFERFPLAAERAYTVPEAPLAEHESMKRVVGLDRTVHDEAILPYRDLDVGELLDVLIEAVPDAAAREAILTDNPKRLYGFER